MKETQYISILGSTGSIGINTLKVISANADRYRVFALTARNSIDALSAQCRQYRPEFAVLETTELAARLQRQLLEQGQKTRVLSGCEGLLRVAEHEQVDCVMAGIVGSAGLLPCLAAARSGKKVLLANKEALVMAGSLFMEAVSGSGAILLPIDSEHNAIFQCLPINDRGRFENEQGMGFEKIVLTASGGPFLNMPVEEMGNVSPEQACRHPNWKMGPKISVDSATMMNKALELIEASYLFDLEEDKIDIVIHPQSIVHSMVHYRDGSVLAQMGNPDMRTPIAYGLAWPQRIDSGVKTLDLVRAGPLEFLSPDEQRFPCLRLGRQVCREKGMAPVMFNAANEIAVQAFLDGRLSFGQIPAIIEDSLERQAIATSMTLEMIVEQDAETRRVTEELIRTKAA